MFFFGRSLNLPNICREPLQICRFGYSFILYFIFVILLLNLVFGDVMSDCEYYTLSQHYSVPDLLHEVSPNMLGEIRTFESEIYPDFRLQLSTASPEVTETGGKSRLQILKILSTGVIRIERQMRLIEKMRCLVFCFFFFHRYIGVLNRLEKRSLLIKITSTRSAEMFFF